MTPTPAIAGLAVSVLLLAACSAQSVAQPTPDLEQTVQARVSAALAAQHVPTLTSVPGDLAQSRSGEALSVWDAPAAAYLAQFPSLAASVAQTRSLRCTVQPFTNVQVFTRDVGFSYATLPPTVQEAVHRDSYQGATSEAIAQVANVDGRCSGYVAVTLLTH